MDANRYWDLLTKEQKDSYLENRNYIEDELGLDVGNPIDAIDIWECISEPIRGSKPE